jgi:LacI family transcriptional regulator
MVSLKDIAAKFGVSTTTVSWVLSGKGDARNISKKMQEMVRKCAEELNYTPNSLARSLSTGLSKTIGLIVPSISDSFYSTIANRIEKEAHKAGYTLMIASSNSDGDKEEELIKVYEEKQVDGIILAPTKLTRCGIDRLISRRVPLVFIDRFYPELNVSSVVIDNENASYQLVKGLVEKGRKRIAIVTTNTHLLTMDMRRMGYVRALQEAGLTVDKGLCCDVPIHDYRQEIIPALELLFKNYPDVDGIFFTSHILLIEALNFFKRSGINLNDAHISFASMRTETLLRVIASDLDVAHFPEDEMGRNAVRILIGHINSLRSGLPFKTESIVLDCNIDRI